MTRIAFGGKENDVQSSTAPPGPGARRPRTRPRPRRPGIRPRPQRFPARGRPGGRGVSYTFESYDEFWRGTTRVSNPGVGEVEIVSFTFWGQYGLTDGLALVVNLPYIDADSDGGGGFGQSDLQDFSALLRYRFVDVRGGTTRHSLVGAAGGRFPGSGYVDNEPVDVGDGSSDVLLRLVYQLENGPFYFSQQVGYDVRGGDSPDGIPLYTEVGYTFGRVTATGYYFDYMADGGSDIGDPNFTFTGNKDETTRVGGKLYGRLTDRFGISVLYFTTLDGRNSGDASGWSLGGVAQF